MAHIYIYIYIYMYVCVCVCAQTCRSGNTSQFFSPTSLKFVYSVSLCESTVLDQRRVECSASLVASMSLVRKKGNSVSPFRFLADVVCITCERLQHRDTLLIKLRCKATVAISARMEDCGLGHCRCWRLRVAPRACTCCAAPEPVCGAGRIKT